MPASAAACSSTTFESLPAPRLNIGRPQRWASDAATPFGSGPAYGSTIVRRSSESPPKAGTTIGAPSRASCEMTTPARTPAVLMAIVPARVIGPVVPPEVTGIHSAGTPRSAQARSLRTESSLKSRPRVTLM